MHSTRQHKNTVKWRAVVFGCVVAVCVTSHAHSATLAELVEMSLEELMKITITELKPVNSIGPVNKADT